MVFSIGQTVNEQLKVTLGEETAFYPNKKKRKCQEDGTITPEMT